LHAPSRCRSSRPQPSLLSASALVQEERHPEMVRKARARVALDSVLTAWLESVTFPGLA
jgi:hypothetical protein